MAAGSALEWDEPGIRLLTPFLKRDVERIDNPQSREMVLYTLLAAVGFCEEPAAAREYALEIAKRPNRTAPFLAYYSCRNLLRLSEGQKQRGDRRAARETIRLATELILKAPRAGSLEDYASDLVDAMVELGDHDAAANLLAIAPPVERPATKLIRLAQGFARNGEPEQAADSYRKARAARVEPPTDSRGEFRADKPGDDAALDEAIAFEAYRGREHAAIAWARSVPSESDRARSMGSIVQITAERGQLAEALQLARELESATDRCKALGGLALGISSRLEFEASLKAP
jgi:hypothetical protein